MIFHDPFFDFSNPMHGYSMNMWFSSGQVMSFMDLTYLKGKTEYIYWDETYGYIDKVFKQLFPDNEVRIKHWC